jgi:hypothetical protein
LHSTCSQPIPKPNSNKPNFKNEFFINCLKIKKKLEWLENIDNAKKQLKTTGHGNETSQRRTGDLASSVIEEEDEEFDEDELDGSAVDDSFGGGGGSGSRSKKKTPLDLATATDHERTRILRELFSEFDILLAQRDFEKAVEMLLKIKNSTTVQQKKQPEPTTPTSSSNSQDPVQQLIYKQKETELISILRKDLVQSKERGNSKGVVKTGKRVVSSLIKLRIYDEAMDLFIDYHKYLNAETLRRIKLEESNQIYMNNVLDSFFDNLRQSYLSFKEQFSEGGQVHACFSTYLSWCDTEVEILIRKLESQHYLGRQFVLTVENCELIFIKARQFSEFDVRFLFETKLASIVEQAVREQLDILIDASIQRSKVELDDTGSAAHNEQSRQVQLQTLLKDLETKQLVGAGVATYFTDKDVELIRICTITALQFSRGALDFFANCMRVYYQDVSYRMVESLVKLFKAEIKIYGIYLSKSASGTASHINRQDVQNNVLLIERVFSVVEAMYFERTGVHAKQLVKLVDKIAKFKEENFMSI